MTWVMGGAASFKPFTVTFPIIVTALILISPRNIMAARPDDEDSKENTIPSLEDYSTSPPAASPTGNSGHKERKPNALKPNAAVVVGVLTITFSLTFLLLLYIKHCKSGSTFITGNANQRSDEKKNSGVDRAVVEALPIFRFGSLRGQKNGLECAVCLTGFEDPEVLRLLPKCKHAFHVECVDTWLDAHSTCPLCRDKVDPEDFVLVVEPRQNAKEEESPESGNNNNNDNDAPQSENLGSRRVSERHSSVGERDEEFLQIVLQEKQEQNTETSSFRRSLDNASGEIKSVGKKMETSSSRRYLDSATGGIKSVGQNMETSSSRRHLDSATGEIKSEGQRMETSSLRRDGERTNAERHRLEHRIIISHSFSRGGVHERWSDVQPSDLLYLTSEKIISDASSYSRRGRRTVREQRHNVDDEIENGFGVCGGGSGVMKNLRSVSEMTGMSRFLRGNKRERGGREEQEQQREGSVSRWLGSVSRSQTRRGDVS
ncbi:Zinc finger, RING-type [Sesbania bispinosa]|nr:Zinc finger, RING-type [Sesbania bispinosa]